MNKPILIGLSGLAGCGKDTVRNILQANHSFAGIAFADPIRDMLSTLLTKVDVDPHYWMTDRSLKEQPVPGIGVSYREMAQRLGTEWGREMEPRIWINIADSRMRRLHNGGRDVVISDVRFPNEAEWIKACGGHIWKVLRPSVEPVRQHISEANYHRIPYDYVIDNSRTTLDLEHAVRKALESINN